MVLDMPDFIARARVADVPITHSWDDADPGKAYLTPDEALQDRIDRTSDRGVIALSLGFAEWIAWRFRFDPSHLTLLQVIEAGWAAEVDWRYLSTVVEKLHWKEWHGPVRGPICASVKLVRDVIRLIRTGQFASPEAVCLSRLVLYVLPNSELFKEWRRFAIRRLSEVNSSKQSEVLGKPIPREALNPEWPYSPKDANRLLMEYVRRLKHSENPYLASPQAMKKAGFEGRPYND